MDPNVQQAAWRDGNIAGEDVNQLRRSVLWAWWIHTGSVICRMV